MSSLNIKSLARFAVAAGLTLSVSACFRPLYGPTASGESLQTVLASIEVPETEWPARLARTGHYLRSELIYDLNGSGSDTPKRYTLKMTLTQTESSPVIDTAEGTSSSMILTGTLTYFLTSLDGKTPITQGTATSTASYDRFPQRFANVRAARDAEIRLAKTLAEQVKIRLAAALSASG